MSFRVFNPVQEIVGIFINYDGSLNIPRFLTEPSVPSSGCLYYNTTDDTLYVSIGIDSWLAVSGSGTLGPALTSIASLTTSGNEMLYTTASNTYQTSPITATGRSFLTYSTSAEQRTGLGLDIGTDVQGYSPILDSLETIASTADILPYSSAGIYSSTPVSSWTRTNLLNVASASALNTVLNTITAGSVSLANAILKVSSANVVTQSGILIDASNNITGLNDLAVGGGITLTGNLDSMTPFIRTQLANIGVLSITATQWGYLSGLDQALATTNTPTFAGGILTGTLNMSSNKILNVADPTLSTDGANKAYVDSVAGAGIFPLASGNAATTVELDVTYNSGAGTLTANPITTTLTVDTVSVTASDGKRIVIKNQSAQAQNGVYTRTADVGGAYVLTRTSDFNTAPVPQGTYILVTGGSTNINTSWILSEAVAAFTDPVIWTQFSSTQNITTGNGLTSVGSVWSVDPTARFTFSGSELELATVPTTYGGTGLVLAGGDTNKVLVTDGTNPMTIVKSAPTGDFVGTSDSQALTDKTLTSNTNNIISRALWANSGAGSVSVYAAAVPSTGQVLTATNATTATWQTPTVTTSPSNTLFVYTSATNVSPNYSTLGGALADGIATGATATTPCQIIMYSGTFSENNPLDIPPWVTVTGVSANQTNVVIKATNAGVNILNMKGNARLNGLVIDGNTGAGYATIGIYSYLGGGGGDPASPAQDGIANITVRNCSSRGIQVTGDTTQYSKLLIARNIAVLVTVLSVMTYAVYCSAGAIISGDILNISGFFVGSTAYIGTGIYCTDKYSYVDISSVGITSVGTCIYCGGSVSNTQADYPTIRISDMTCDLYSLYGLYSGPKSVLRLSDTQIISDITGIDPYTAQVALYFENPALPADKNFLVGLWTNIRVDKVVFNGGATNNLPEIRGSNLSEVPNYVENMFSGKVAIGTPVLPASLSAGNGNSFIEGMVIFVYNATANTSTNYTTEASYVDASGFDVFPSPLATNHAFYVGGDFIYSGIKLGLLTAIALSSGSILTALTWEYWDGSAWSDLPFMITLAAAPYTNYGTQSFGVGTVLAEQTDYQYRFGQITDWSTTLSAGASIVLPVGMTDSLRYYVRARVLVGGVTQISTVPVADMTRLQTSQTKINESGFMEYFGTARISRRMPIPNATLMSSGIAGETDPNSQRLIATSWATSTISATVPSCKFANNATTVVVFTVTFPNELCSSCIQNLVLNYSRGNAGGATGNISWQLDYIYTDIGDTIGDPNGSVTTAGQTTGVISVSAPTVSRTQGQAVIPFSLLGIDVTDVVWFKLTRFGSSDSFSGDIYLFNLYVDYVIWANGAYLA